MSEPHQLPLFALEPRFVEDLSAYTPLYRAIPFFKEFLYKQGKTDHTVTSFASDLSILLEFGDGERALGALDTERLEQFLRWMEHDRGVPCSRKTYARRVTTLKVFFKWLADLNVIGYNPAVPLVQRSGPAPLAPILQPEQVEAALAYALTLRMKDKPDARPEWVFRLILTTGIKKSEAMALTLADIDRTARPAMMEIKAQTAKQVYKARRIPLDGDLLGVLDAYRGQYPTEGNLFTCTPRNLEYILENIGMGAGLPLKISFEMLRWTCAVRDYQAGMPPDAIRDKLGLSEISWRETFSKIRRLSGEHVPEEEAEDDA